MRKSILVILFVSVVLGCQGWSGRSAGAPPKNGFTAAADGTRIAYTVRGEAPTTLVFLHGWACDRGYWDNQAGAFSTDYRVVTVDLPGHGSSGTDREQWTLTSLARDVKAVVEALKLERVILVGHSLGGAVALKAAAAMPELVIGVVGVDTLQDADWKMDPQQEKELIDSFRSDFAGACDRFVRSMFRQDADAELVTRTATDMCDARPDIATALLADVSRFDAAAALQAVKVPVRCINSDMWTTNVEGNGKYADFDAVILEGLGHFPMLERPAEFNGALADVVAKIEAGG